MKASTKMLLMRNEKDNSRAHWEDHHDDGREIMSGSKRSWDGYAINEQIKHIPDYSHKTENHETNVTSGYAAGKETPPLSRNMAEAWSNSMENEDGTKGPHWTIEQTKQVQTQHGIDCDPLEFYLAMNMMYSDYVKVAKKLSVNNAEFYAYMAQAFLDDRDAAPNKLSKYYHYIVKK